MGEWSDDTTPMIRPLRLLTFLALLCFLAIPGSAQDRAIVAGNHDQFRQIEGTIVRETRHFRIYAEGGFIPVDLDWFQKEAERAYDYVSERIGVRSAPRFSLVFRPPDTSPCPVRGIAFPDSQDPQTV